MEFIQKKTADRAVEHFLMKAVDQEISTAWDRFEGQLPECGFCEAGLSCRDCLQGPCISHPFRNDNKIGVCGKDKDVLAAQSLLRLVLKGTMAQLDQVSDFAEAVASGEIEANYKDAADQILKDFNGLLDNGDTEAAKSLPKVLVENWKKAGVLPQGVARDVFKATQKLEGGITSAEETLLWAFKCALLGCAADALGRKLQGAVFGEIAPTDVEVNLGVLQKGQPNILIYGPVSPALKKLVIEKAKDNNINVMGVCTDSLLPPYTISPVSNYGSQDIALMTGAVDLVVAGDQFVNPSMAGVAKDWKVKIVSINGIKQSGSLADLADEIVKKAQESFELRTDIPKDIPDAKTMAKMGYSPQSLDVKKIVDALNAGTIKGIAVFSGSNNVKYTQDNEFVAMAEAYLKNDILCISEGEASVCLAKYGFLTPGEEKECGEGIKGFLGSLGDNSPAVIDCNAVDFLVAVAGVENKALNEYPIAACFAEANRSAEVAKALSLVAMGVSTYFWPCLPVTGSPKTMGALTDLCGETFGGQLHIITARIDAPAKAELFIKAITSPASMAGKSWQ